MLPSTAPASFSPPFIILPNISPTLPALIISAAPPAAAAATEAPASNVVASASAHSTGNERLKASPLAKRIAREKGIDLSAVAGSGDQGRITRKDVEGFKPSAAAPAKPSPTPSTQAAAKPSPLQQKANQVAKQALQKKIALQKQAMANQIQQQKLAAKNPGLNN